MQCKDIMAMIEGTYPKSAALGFDNVGLQEGRSEKEVRRIYLALDATDAVIFPIMQCIPIMMCLAWQSFPDRFWD